VLDASRLTQFYRLIAFLQTQVLDKHNCLDLLRELDQRMQLGDISSHMLSLAVGRGTFFTDIIDLAEREVDKAPNGKSDRF
jgi:hypothetical protein